MKIQLKNLKPEETALFQIKMKEAFEQGLIDRLGSADAGPVPPEDEADHALSDESMDVFIITADGIPAGGTVIKREADGKYSLDLLFIFREFLNKKNRLRRVAGDRKPLPGCGNLGNLHPVFRAAQHSFLSEQMRISDRGVLQRISPGEA